jgi:hypothetical protein
MVDRAEDAHRRPLPTWARAEGARQFPDRLRRGLLLAPLVFVAHFLEESPGFVPWFNAHVAPGITQDTFWAVNITGLLITILLTLGFWATQSAASVLLVVAWLSFLMLTNALFHITGAIVERAYVPGLVTAIALYLPYSVWVAVQVVRSRRNATGVVAAAAVLGGIPHGSAWVPDPVPREPALLGHCLTETKAALWAATCTCPKIDVCHTFNPRQIRVQRAFRETKYYGSSR